MTGIIATLQAAETNKEFLIRKRFLVEAIVRTHPKFAQLQGSYTFRELQKRAGFSTDHLLRSLHLKSISKAIAQDIDENCTEYFATVLAYCEKCGITDADFDAPITSMFSN